MLPEDDDLAYEDGPDDGTTAEPPKKRRGGPPPASEKQLNFARLLKDKVGLSDDEFATLLQDVSGQDSMENLTVADASGLIDELQIKAKERGVDLNTQTKASDKQIGFIKSLKRRAHLTDDEFAELLQELAGVTEVEEVGKRDASALIDELQKRAKGEGSAGGGAKKAPAKKAPAQKKSGGGARRARHEDESAPPPREDSPPAWDDDDVPF